LLIGETPKSTVKAPAWALNVSLVTVTVSAWAAVAAPNITAATASFLDMFAIALILVICVTSSKSS
jgi:hypothetical protein